MRQQAASPPEAQVRGKGDAAVWRFWVAALATAALDQVTKAWALRELEPGVFVPLGDRWVGLRLIANQAGAFGLIQPAWIPTATAAAACCLLVAVVATGRLRGRPRLLVPLGLLLGGAAGNLADRLRYGAVIDFLDFRVWPVFNIADAAITLGLAGLAWRWLRPGPDGPTQDEAGQVNCAS